MIVHVRNFGKIESADIDLSNLTIFVGENNSGKTYLMQLIYGLIDWLYEVCPYRFFDEFKYVLEDDMPIKIEPNNSDFYIFLQKKLNKFINKYKYEIIEKIFHTRHLTIDTLSVEFADIKDAFELSVERDNEFLDIKGNNGALALDILSTNPWEAPILDTEEKYSIYKNGKAIYQMIVPKKSNSAKSLFFMSILLGALDLPPKFHIPQNSQLLYLPALRSGLMLLYANYFANNTKKKHEFIDNSEPVENEFGLTKPTHDFLTFLLTYKASEMISDKRKELISFVNKNIIEGEIKQYGNEMRYKSDCSEQYLPMSLSPSSVLDLTPIYQILSGIQQYKFILYDEIEAGLHPTKQLQLARLLVRMVNAGYRMIVSTHSDTMASAINNLLKLSFKNNKLDILEKLGYEEADILKSTNVKAYQFIIGENGKTRVIEVPSHFSIGLGFDFDLFNKANDKIYNDALKIAEVE